MKKYGKIAVVLDQKEYRKLEGLLKECLPSHVPIDIRRVKNKIELWAEKPRIMKTALDKARELHRKYGTEAMAKIWEIKEKKPKKAKKKVVRKKPVTKVKRIVRKKPKKKVAKKKQKKVKKRAKRKPKKGRKR